MRKQLLLVAVLGGSFSTAARGQNPPPPVPPPGATGWETHPRLGGHLMPGQSHQVVPSFEDMLFPPELVMQHQRALELTAEQRKSITEAIKALQNQTTDLQWNLQAEQSALMELLQQRPIREPAAATQINKLLELEATVKRTHLATLVRIKNTLTDKQIGQLNDLRARGGLMGYKDFLFDR